MKNGKVVFRIFISLTLGYKIRKTDRLSTSLPSVLEDSSGGDCKKGLQYDIRLFGLMSRTLISRKPMSLEFKVRRMSTRGLTVR